jgi:hypothetical protein
VHEGTAGVSGGIVVKEHKGFGTETVRILGGMVGVGVVLFFFDEAKEMTNP